jgi:hypothetical protein
VVYDLEVATLRCDKPFADAPFVRFLLLFYCALSARAPRGHLSSQPALYSRTNGVTPRLSAKIPILRAICILKFFKGAVSPPSEEPTKNAVLKTALPPPRGLLLGKVPGAKAAFFQDIKSHGLLSDLAKMAFKELLRERRRRASYCARTCMRREVERR